ncbi:hypothetical protein [Flavobacterium gilvum]|uniref:Acid-shock protein n=1 Tax=Flavobacterium gilvum TaxID=1492737 RepID=A0AAC9I5A3_9FLAO|nr:hypothetical protein [Flavobacterium gilvum]AOW09138.1 hypothetical protein EM308_06250 [Flavobacterium gilvum]KFC60854.1 hypothetical protein FEM08_03410 [Flavobacterium gilvum]
MKNLLMVLALALGTTVMVSAQTKPASAQTAPAKEVKATKKEAKKTHKTEAAKVVTTAEPAAAKK